jgi:uncharacterized lipoprotein YddW (UPF0748 family)
MIFCFYFRSKEFDRNVVFSTSMFIRNKQTDFNKNYFRIYMQTHFYLKKIVPLFMVVFFIGTYFTIQAQTNSPKYEFRSAWVATIGGIDWPSKNNLSTYEQQQELTNLFFKFQRCGLNAAIVQIRPTADAFYNSPYEQWSKYLTGAQGVAPNPYYDPLTFMCAEAHKYGLELHAWFNPYRALVDANKNPNQGNHITYEHPEWFINYGGKKYFDPGLPEVRSYFIKIVMDVVKRYDIDAVHFDDYFYPYRIAKVEFGDYKSYARYGAAFDNKDDWRRHNVDVLIETLSKKIKQEKAWVKFGISPFGVWRNYSKDPEGSYTNGGQTNYDDLYADVIKWQRNGWIDYLLPQLYWERGHRAADYVELIRWWSEHAYNKHMYIGHGLYQLGKNKAGAWRSLNEIKEQINLTRTTKNIHGSAFYSANFFYKNVYGFSTYLQNEAYKKPAISPIMNWLPMIKPTTPKVTKQLSNDGTVLLTWNIIENKNDWYRYVVYKFNKNEKIDLSNSSKIQTILTANSYVDATQNVNEVKYVVTAVNRLGVESDVE